MVQESLRATADSEGEKERLLSKKESGSIEGRGESLNIPLQVADHKLLDAGIGGLNGLAELLQAL